MNPNDNILTVDEVAKKLRKGKSWLYKKVAARIVPHYRVGGSVLFSEREINDWLQSHHVKGCQKI